MPLTVGELVAYASVDNKAFERGTNQIERTLQQTAKVADAELGKIPAAARAAGEQTGEQFTVGADGKLRDSKGRFVATGRKSGDAVGRGFGLGMKSGLGGIVADVAKLVGKAGVQVMGLTANVAKVGLLAGGLFAAAQGAGALVAALAPAAGLVAALPAAFLLAKAAAGTLKVALLGVQEAIGAALTGDAAAFEASLKGLSPAAQSVARELRAVKPEIDGLKASVQDAFFEPLKGQLTAVAAALLGPVKAGMTGVSGEFGRLAADVGKFGRSKAAVELVKGAFGTLKTEIGSIQSGTLQKLLEAISNFAKSTLPAFKGLGAGIDGAAKSFTDWLNAATAAGKPMEWIQSALDVLAKLGAVFSDIGGIVKSVMGAMGKAGVSALGPIGMLLDKVNAFFASAKGQDILIKIFQSLGKVVDALWPIFEELASAAALVAPVIADVAAALGPGIAAAIKALGPALAAMGPGLVAIADAMAKAFADPTVASSLLLLGQAIAGLLKGFAPLIPVVVKIGAALVGGLSKAILAITPHLPDLVAAFGELLLTMIPLIDPVVDLVIALTPLIPVMTDLIKITTEISKILVTVLVWAIKGVTDQVRRWVNDFRASWDQGKAIVLGFVDKVKSILAWFGELPGLLGKWVGQAKTAATDKFGQLVEWVKKLPEKIVGALGDLGKMLLKVGKDAIQGLINGIKSKAEEVSKVVTSLLRGDVLGAAATAIEAHSPSRAMQRLGVWTVEGFILGITGSQERMRTTVTNLVTLVQNAFKAAPGHGDHLANWVKANTDVLGQLADRREQIIKRIADAKAYATQIAGQAADFAAITNIDLGEGGGIGDLTTGLANRLSAIRDFANNIKTLAARGLNKTILKQIIDAGPEKGGTLADMLVGASGADLKAINRAQAQIDKISKTLGKTAADALYDTGKQAGQGFLKGLKGQLKEMEGAMAAIAKAVVAAAKKELASHSPSRVFMGIGKDTLLGFQLGIKALAGTTISAVAGVMGKAVNAASGLQLTMPKSQILQPMTGPTSAPAGPGFVEGSQGGVTVHMHGTTIREEADIQRIGAEFAFGVLSARG
ncbi:hypothetical protein GCM10009555_017360 [Acrocarpospora macrocephala]|uniref:Tape measure protein n=1 Tax=Acrocarpospora macrocephala TaxID=150177 RepID=A0A5M3WF17_9ACTN|nr:hypothetical protein [Acrocarpospora macrocephala]GES07396.1 hypothetical protein Amac_009910 [Acrocarpospora macrocephala]